MDTDDRFKHLASDPRFKTLRKKQRKVKIDERFQSMFTDERFTLKYSKDKRGRDQKKTSGDDLKRYYSLEKTNKSEVEDEVDDENDEEEGEEEDVHGAEEDLEDEDADDEDVDDEDEVDDEDVDDKRVKKIADEDAESEGEDISAEINDEEEEEEESDIGSEDGEESESDLSTSSDEPESDIDGYDSDGRDIDITKLNYDWQPLDADAEKADATSCRLAIQNLDWDHLDVRDVYILVNSIRPPMSVKIFVSEFGKERLAKEDQEGPQELIERSLEDEEEEELKQLESKMKIMQEQNILGRKFKNHEYEDADEALDPKNEEIREKIRRYQLCRMKYYYAVVEFDSTESAEAVYKELDGMEYEGSSLELDLRFIPDDIEFDSADMKAECNKIPDPTTYKAPQFINSALQQTTVKFTWDETDIKRQEKLQRAYTKEELDKDDLEAYLATDSEEEDDEEEEEDDDEEGGIDRSDAVSVVTANSEARINKYKMLLKSLEEEEDKKKKVDVDVEWGNYDEDEEANPVQDTTGDDNFDDDDDDDADSNDNVDYDDDGADDGLSGSEFSEADESVKRGKTKNEAVKSKRKKGPKSKGKKKHQQKKDGAASGDDDDLDLLVLDVDGRRENEFKFNPDDDRFKAIYESGLYNIDPSHPNFKRTKAFEQMAEKKREKRRKTDH